MPPLGYPPLRLERSAEPRRNAEFSMDSVCLTGPDAQGRAKRGEIFRLLLAVEVNAQDRDRIDLVLQPLRHLIDEGLHVDGGRKLPVDECYVLARSVPEGLKDLLFLALVDPPITFCGLQHGAEHQACDRVLLRRW